MALDFRASQARTNKLIASGSTGTNAKLLFYPFSSALNLSGTINPSTFGTGSIGQDIFLYISGAVGSLDGTGNGATVTGGDLHVSGNLRVQGAILFSSGASIEIGLSDYAATSNIFSTIVGQHRFDPTDYLARPIYLRGNLAVSNTAANLSVRLWNVTSGTYVEIGGPGITHFVVSGTTPTFFQSVNLVSASGFSSGPAIYELHASVSNGSYVGYVGGWNFAVTGAGVQGPQGPQGIAGADGIFVTSGVYSKTSQSVAFGAGPGFVYPDVIGTDIFFFVSGSSTAKSVFGGDLVLSGNLTTWLSNSFQGPTTASHMLLNDGAVMPYDKAISSINSASNGTLTLVFASTAGLLSNPANTVVLGDYSNANAIALVGQNTFYGFLQYPTGSFFSGSIQFPQGISGSLTQLSDGTSYLRSGTGVVINSASNGAVTITGSAGKYGRLFIGKYTSTNNTSSNPEVCGQNYWDPADWGFVPGSSSVYLQAILSAEAINSTSFVRLWNATAGAYVEIGGPGITEISTSQITPTRLLSVDLTGALNFQTGSAQVYEVQIYTSVGPSACILGSCELLTQV